MRTTGPARTGAESMHGTRTPTRRCSRPRSRPQLRWPPISSAASPTSWPTGWRTSVAPRAPPPPPPERRPAPPPTPPGVPRARAHRGPLHEPATRTLTTRTKTSTRTRTSSTAKTGTASPPRFGTPRPSPGSVLDAARHRPKRRNGPSRRVQVAHGQLERPRSPIAVAPSRRPTGSADSWSRWSCVPCTGRLPTVGPSPARATSAAAWIGAPAAGASARAIEWSAPGRSAGSRVGRSGRRAAGTG